MSSLRYTKNLFLRAVCVVYLFAFISFYIQIPGLYGDNGILPARSVLENSKHKVLSAKVHYQPTLLWLAPFLELDTQYALDALALLGSFLAFTGFVSQKLCTVPLFAGLWSLYFSLYQVGQTFVQNNYDELLLEIGFLALLIAPLLPVKRKTTKVALRDSIGFWLLRWLLFRILVTSCLSKLISGCPKWWNLTALNYYFETAPLPSPLSWYAHHLPLWILKSTTVLANVAELFLPVLFFVPLRPVKFTAFTIEILIQICIILTGNFSFSNLLIVILLLSLLDDQSFFGRRKATTKWTVAAKVLNVVIYMALIYLIVILYNIKYNNDYTIDAKIAFTKDQFNNALKQGLTLTIYFAVISLGITVFHCATNAPSQFTTTGGKIASVMAVLTYSVVAFIICLGSTVPLASLHPTSNSSLNAGIRSIYSRLNKLHVINQYQLVPTVQDERFEIIFEGSDSTDGPWHEYNFLYKPGNVNHSLPYVAPHSPRLDWQLHFAAYSTYDKEPWILSLAHRLLLGNKDVLALLDTRHIPFVKKPPKYIHAILYKYKFTSWSQRSVSSWWQREKVSEYLPVLSKDSNFLIDYLKARNLLPLSQKSTVSFAWKEVLDKIRHLTSYFEPTLFLWSIFSAGCAIITMSGKKPRRHLE